MTPCFRFTLPAVTDEGFGEAEWSDGSRGCGSCAVSRLALCRG